MKTDTGMNKVTAVTKRNFTLLNISNLASRTQETPPGCYNKGKSKVVPVLLTEHHTIEAYWVAEV
jgi:hypothetical protein